MKLFYSIFILDNSTILFLITFLPILLIITTNKTKSFCLTDIKPLLLREKMVKFTKQYLLLLSI